MIRPDTREPRVVPMSTNGAVTAKIFSVIKVVIPLAACTMTVSKPVVAKKPVSVALISSFFQEVKVV